MSCPARDLGWWRVTGRVAQCSCCHELSRRMWFTVCTEHGAWLRVDITARPKVRRQVAGWGISANFVSSVQYILSAAELRQKNSVLEELEVKMFGQSIRQHGPRRGVDINSYVVSYKSITSQYLFHCRTVCFTERIIKYKFKTATNILLLYYVNYF